MVEGIPRLHLNFVPRHSLRSTELLYLTYYHCYYQISLNCLTTNCFWSFWLYSSCSTRVWKSDNYVIVTSFLYLNIDISLIFCTILSRKFHLNRLRYYWLHLDKVFYFMMETMLWSQIFFFWIPISPSIFSFYLMVVLKEYFKEYLCGISYVNVNPLLGELIWLIDLVFEMSLKMLTEIATFYFRQRKFLIKTFILRKLSNMLENPCPTWNLLPPLR